MATTHIIAEGETIQRIAKQHGFADWRRIYEHPKNAGVRARSDGPNVLMPGDELFVPDSAPPWVPCGSGAVHEFRLHRERTWLRLMLLGADDQPLAAQPYRLEVGGETHEGVVPDDGRIEHEVDAAATEAVLVVRDSTAEPPVDRRFALELGWLDPIASGKGLQARLANLGHYHGEIDGHEDAAATRRALSTFGDEPPPASGKDAVIEPTSPQSRAALKAAHRC